MFPDPATIARRRHLAVIGVRAAMVGSVFVFVYRVSDVFSEGLATLTAPPAATVGYKLGLNIGWLALAGLLWLIERPLVKWLVPPPQPGCPNCGYSLRNLKTPICPECGADISGSGSR